MIKTMVSGLDGESLARQKVMEEYRAICDTERGEASRTSCYNKYADQINEDVEKMTKAINVVNDRMQAAQEGNIQDEGFFGSGIISNEKYKEDLRKSLDENGEWMYNAGVGVDNIKLDSEDLLSVEQIQSAMLVKELEAQGLTNNDLALRSAKEEFNESIRNVALLKLESESSRRAAEYLSIDGLESRHIVTVLNVDTVKSQWAGLNGDFFKGIPEQYKNKKVQVVTAGGGAAAGGAYLLVLASQSHGGYSGIEEVLKKSDDGTSWVKVPESEKPKDLNQNRLVFYSATSAGECSTKIREGTAQLSFYESGPNKGLPAVVPFDLKNGWYVRIPNSGGTLLDSSPLGYTASAEARYFYICNVGENGLIESTSRDLCQSFDVNTAGLVDRFAACPSMNKDRVNRLFVDAQRAIREASQQYGQSGNYRIFGQTIMRGPPATETNGLECQDFMSPEDCKLMFNACDPVICPSSRCDLGGRLPVADVVQTGIVGSVALCLPNYKDGVYVPVCLTGIHAGIDSYTQILKAEQQCLQQNLKTGETVGICDEITSIYKCEFFWNQVSPLLDSLVPTAIDFASGRGTGVRGGGEYANVANAWGNLQQSIDYFQTNYAQNTFRAYQLRSVNEAGGEFCRAFIGTSLPTSADALGRLLEPESPFQFYAQFDERVFTGATTPPTSQYKVYYNIYAGNDIGAQYRLYLKSPPVSTYYTTRQEVHLKTGYIARGDFVDETLDFTLPSGYKELCVEINNQHHCGFKQVSSSFAINYIQDKYTQDQVEKDITTERQCVSGTSSALSFASLNLQSGVEEALNPDIALRGIVRVCGSVNPGAGVVAQNEVGCLSDVNCGRGYTCKKLEGSERGLCTDSYNLVERRSSRWVDVGYCGDEAIRCWMDLETVRKDLERIEAIEGVTTATLDQQRQLIENVRIDLETVRKILEDVEERVRSLRASELSNDQLLVFAKNITGDLDRIVGTSQIHGSGTDADRANALALKAELFNKIIRDKYIGKIPIPAPRLGEEGDGVVVSPGSNEQCQINN